MIAFDILYNFQRQTFIIKYLFECVLKFSLQTKWCIKAIIVIALHRNACTYHRPCNSLTYSASIIGALTRRRLHTNAGSQYKA